MIARFKHLRRRALFLLARAVSTAALALALLTSAALANEPPVASAEASAVTLPDRWHFDIGFSMPLYRLDTGKMDWGSNPFYRSGDASATLGASIDIYCGAQWCWEAGIAYGMRISLDHRPDASDPVIGPTTGLKYTPWEAGAKLWGVTTTERDPFDSREWALGVLYEWRFDDAIQSLHNAIGDSVTQAFAEWAKEM